MTTVTYTSSGTWTCPAGVTTVDCQAWGEGGKGANGTGTISGAGGSGGEYAEETALSVTSGNNYNFTIGAGGTGTATSFPGDAVTVTAHGGSTGGVATSGSTNSIHHDGGAAGSGGVGVSSGGGGGGSGGSTGAGGTGHDGTAGGGGGTAGSGSPGGAAGGSAGAGFSAGSTGNAPGGGAGGNGKGATGGGVAGAAGQITLTFTSATVTAEADEGAAADTLASQVTSVPPAVITAPPRPAGPAPAPLRAQVLTVPAGSAVPQDTAGAAETALANAAVPLADYGAGTDTFTGFEGASMADAAGAADALAVAGAVPLADPSGAVTELGGLNIYAISTTLADTAAAADASQTTGLTQSEAAAGTDAITANVTGIALADQAGAADGIGQEPAIGASGGSTTPQAMPGTSEVAVAAPGSSTWYYLGSVGQMTKLTYSFACPGGADKMTCTVMVPASYRNQIFNPGWQVRIYRGGHIVWDGKMDEPVPTASGWNMTAVGTGMLGQNFDAYYTSTWPSNQPDESINNAISRGLPWANPGVGTPAGAWFGQGVDPAAQTVSALLNLICTRGQLTWYVNSQPGGVPGDDLSVFPLPTVVNRLLVATTPVPRTLGGDVNTIWLRYQITAASTSSGGSGTATYGITSVQNAASVAQHGVIETYIDISDAGVVSAAQAQAVGNNVLAIYQRASYAGPLTARWGQLLNTGGTPVDPGTDQAGTVVRLVLTDFGYGGEVVPSQPAVFITGAYEWDDFAQVATITPYQSLDQSVTGMLQAANTVLVPVAASGG